jgi:hypothetical protein
MSRGLSGLLFLSSAVIFVFIAVMPSFTLSQCPRITSPITNTTISLNGLSVTFQSSAQMGQYANGDWWIVGPVTMTATSPPWDGQCHGFEINPSSKASPGFDYRLDMYLPRTPALPLIVQPGSSIVKVESLDCPNTTLRYFLNKAVVFTVLQQPPPNNGQFSMRPNYFGAIKYDYDVRNIDFSMLPRIRPTPPLPHAPTLADLVADFAPERLRFDHIEDSAGSDMHPESTMPYYGADVAINFNRAMLRLLYDDVSTTADGKCAVYRFLQSGIDYLAAMRQDGLCFHSDGGIKLGRKLPIIMAVTMLGDTVAEAFVLNRTGWKTNCFHEDGQTTDIELYGDDRYLRPSSDSFFGTELVEMFRLRILNPRQLTHERPLKKNKKLYNS